MFPLLWSAAVAATLPGVSVPFDETEDGQWVLSDALPTELTEAGVQPGWVLLGVDGLAFDDPEVARRRVAAGPARDIQLRLSTGPVPEEGSAELRPPEAIVVARRAPLVRARVVEWVSWPDDFAPPPGAWQTDWAALPVLSDASGAGWQLDPDSGSLRSGATGEWSEASVPEAFWHLSDAAWAVERNGELWVTDRDGARERLHGGIRVPSWRGDAGDHLLRADDQGFEVVAVEWPRGAPTLPTCRPRIPESCLASGTDILRDLPDLPGAVALAADHLGQACANGVNRACYEAVALDDPDAAPRVEACLDGEVRACNEVADERLQRAPDDPDDLVMGLLEYACELEGAGTLGERLRRLEDVAAGCMGLAAASDARGLPDQALLNLDQACVLGRADACEEAEERRAKAYALRTVRECEDPELPIAASCVEQGRLLQEGEVPVATLDDFAAFSRGCSLGATEGCVLLGDYVDRWGITHPRVVQAESDLRAACDRGEQRACLGAAHLLVRHEPRSEAYAEALQLFTDTCADGLAAACIGGAEQRRIGTARKTDAPEPIALWEDSCELNAPDGCAGLGERYARRKSEWPDAFGAWTRACDLGDPHACSQLGRLVQDSSDPFEGAQPADAYLSRGCDSGDPEGCFWLAQTDLPKKGDPPEDAYLLLSRSCDGEYGPGCDRLAEVHIDRKTSFDDEIAARHYDTACDNGHYESCRELGTMYLRGKGVERDPEKARELFDRFRLNAKRRHLRIGPTVGIAAGAGLEGEVVIPVPVGPALSVGGTFSYLPGAGSVLVLIEGEGTPDQAPDLQVVQGIARLYPNTQARGLYAAAGIHRVSAIGGSTDDRSRTGFSGRIGLRSQSGFGYSTLEIGMGTFGDVQLSDFDEDESGSFPLLLPTVSFGFGFALL